MKPRYVHLAFCVGVLLTLALATLALGLPLGASPVQAAAPAGSGPALLNAQATPTVRLYLPVLLRELPSTSFDLIERARAAGKITDEQALVYRVFATFSDPRLPAAFTGAAGAGTQNEGQAAMREASARYPTLSHDTRQQLFEFFEPPVHVDSWYQRQHPLPPGVAQAAPAEAAAPQDQPAPPAARDPRWKFIVSAIYPIKVWWLADDEMYEWMYYIPTAQKVVEWIDSNVWPDETKLMGGRTPQPDDGPHIFLDPEDGKWKVWGDGGSERLDIYLIRGLNPDAITVAYPPNCTDTPAFILLDPLADEQKKQAAVAHEFMHTLQYSYKYAKACPEYEGMEEAGANWAIDFVYPQNQYEHFSNGRYRWPESALWKNAQTGYGDWMFFYYLTKQYNNTLFRTIWDKVESMGPYDALDSSVEGGFKQQWPQYAVKLWNRTSERFFQEWDDLDETPDGRPLRSDQPSWNTDYTNQVELKGERAAKYEIKFELPYLSQTFYHFAFPDSEVRSVGFYNPFAIGGKVSPPEAAVWALIKLQGHAEWEPPEDWTAIQEMDFCRDLADERLEELVLVFSYSQWKNPTRTMKTWSPATLTASNIGCRGWEGTVTAVDREDNSVRHSVETSNVTATFERSPRWHENTEYGMFVIKQGSLHWEFTGTNGKCTMTSPTRDVSLGPNNGMISIRRLRKDPFKIGEFEGSGTAPFQPVVTMVCPDGNYPYDWVAQSWLSTGPDDQWVSKDGHTIDGKYEYSIGDKSGTITWHFVEVPAGQ